MMDPLVGRKSCLLTCCLSFREEKAYCMERKAEVILFMFYVVLPDAFF